MDEATFLNMFPNEITPSEGEIKVRAYHCAELQSKFFKVVKAEGVLTITNKRVIFRTKGIKNDKNFIHSELPILDVAGVAIEKGNFFDWVKLVVIYFLLSPIVSFIIGIPLVLPAILAAASTSIFKFMFRLSAKDITTLSMVLTVLFLIVEIILIVRFAKDKKDKIKKYGGQAKNILQNLLSLLNPFRPALALKIVSKSGEQGAINISAVQGFGFVDVSAQAVPTDKAISMASEIGAIISDFQTLGDSVGIEKWKKE